MIPKPHPLTELKFQFPQPRQLATQLGLPLTIYRDAQSKAFVVIDWMFSLGYVNGCAAWVPFVQEVLFTHGSSRYSPAELREYVDFYGASLQLSVYANFSQLRLFVPSRYAPQLLALSCHLLSAKLNSKPKQFARLQARLLAQHRVQLEKNDYLASKELERSLHGPKSPYNSSYSLEDLQGVEESRVLEFFYSLRSQLYQIFLSGKPTDSLIAKMLKSFAHLQPAPYPEAQFVPPRVVKVQHRHLPARHAGGTQVSIQLGRRIVDHTHADAWGLQVLNTALGGYFGSRLMQSIREEKGYTYGIYSQIVSYLFHSNWQIRTQVNAEYRDLCIAEILKCMQTLHTQALAEHELLDVKNYLIKNLLKSMQNPLSIMHSYQQLFLKRKNLNYFQQWLNYIRQIDSATLQALAQKYLRAEQFSVITALG